MNGARRARLPTTASGHCARIASAPVEIHGRRLLQTAAQPQAHRHQRRYRDRKNWRKGDTADPLLHVVVYNGDRRLDAPLTLAWLLAGGRRTDRRLAVRYEVVDLVGARLDAVPRAKLLRRVAEVEQSMQAGTLPERVRELGECLPELAEPGLTTTFDLWLGALAEKLGGVAIDP